MSENLTLFCMYRLDKIDAQLVHVVPAVDRFGAAAAADAGAKCRVRRQVDTFSAQP
jgi:hypothetical protein